LSSRPRLLAEPAPAGGWRYWRDGRPVAGAAVGRAAAVAVVLPPGAALTREVQFPRLPLADVRRMVALDLDRLSPLRPDLVFVDVEVVDRDSAAGRQTVLVGVLPRETAARQLAAARDEGLSPKALRVAAAEGPAGEGPVGRFDFLPAVRRAAGEKPTGRTARYWWMAAGALLVVNLAVLVGRDILAVSRLRDEVAAQRGAVDAVLAVRRRVEGETTRRLDLVARGTRNEPLRMLAALTAAIPAGAWVQRLEWNGQTLHVVGAKGAEVDMFAALRGSPAFTNPRAAPAEAAARAGPGQPFDITADAGKRPRP
jgi:general secretion pathway protein L